MFIHRIFSWGSVVENVINLLCPALSSLTHIDAGAVIVSRGVARTAECADGLSSIVTGTARALKAAAYTYETSMDTTDAFRNNWGGSTERGARHLRQRPHVTAAEQRIHEGGDTRR
ncbi:hypothetical protein [Massilia timonae]|uniref:hypothetical protein n=1 Tax=Massilia timonae TaxID=47229 RepID=UPI0014614962|nr:hypothetical protein [Massilia timonae]